MSRRRLDTRSPTLTLKIHYTLERHTGAKKVDSKTVKTHIGRVGGHMYDGQRCSEKSETHYTYTVHTLGELRMRGTNN